MNAQLSLPADRRPARKGAGIARTGIRVDRRVRRVRVGSLLRVAAQRAAVCARILAGVPSVRLARPRSDGSAGRAHHRARKRQIAPPQPYSSNSFHWACILEASPPSVDDPDCPHAVAPRRTLAMPLQVEIVVTSDEGVSKVRIARPRPGRILVRTSGTTRIRVADCDMPIPYCPKLDRPAFWTKYVRGEGLVGRVRRPCRPPFRFSSSFFSSLAGSVADKVKR